MGRDSFNGTVFSFCSDFNSKQTLQTLIAPGVEESMNYVIVLRW